MSISEQALDEAMRFYRECVALGMRKDGEISSDTLRLIIRGAIDRAIEVDTGKVKGAADR